MRVAVADAMRRSWTRPIAHVGMPVCLDPLFAYRKVARPKPGPALCALRALAVALAENSAPAGRLVGNKIVHPSSIDIGFAVEAEDGVLVPVIRNADKRLLKDLIAPYNELVELARATQTAAERHRRFHRHRHQFRHLRSGMGHADSAAGTDARAGHGRGAARAALGLGQRPVRADHGGEPDVELRPSRDGRRRGGPVAPARRGFDVASRSICEFICQRKTRACEFYCFPPSLNAARLSS